jgi:hypothetical protein
MPEPSQNNRRAADHSRDAAHADIRSCKSAPRQYNQCAETARFYGHEAPKQCANGPILCRARAAAGRPVLLALLATAMPQWAQAQATLEKIKSRGQINVGYRSLAAPLSFHQTPEKPLGYSIEFCKPIVERLRQAAGNRNLPVRYIETEVDARARLLAEGSVDLLCENVTDTPERRAP